MCKTIEECKCLNSVSKILSEFKETEIKKLQENREHPDRVSFVDFYKGGIVVGLDKAIEAITNAVNVKSRSLFLMAEK